MQHGDISLTEFHKVLQKVQKYHKVKADIRNQAKTKIKQITKEQREELLELGGKKRKEDFLRKMDNSSGIQDSNVIKNMNLPHHTKHDFIVFINHKISLKLVFPKFGINFRIQHHACTLIYHCVTIDLDIFLKSFPCEFPYRIFHQPLIIHVLINDLLLSMFIQARHTDGGI